MRPIPQGGRWSGAEKGEAKDEDGTTEEGKEEGKNEGREAGRQAGREACRWRPTGGREACMHACHVCVCHERCACQRVLGYLNFSMTNAVRASTVTE